MRMAIIPQDQKKEKAETFSYLHIKKCYSSKWGVIHATGFGRERGTQVVFVVRARALGC